MTAPRPSQVLPGRTVAALTGCAVLALNFVADTAGSSEADPALVPQKALARVRDAG